MKDKTKKDKPVLQEPVLSPVLYDHKKGRYHYLHLSTLIKISNKKYQKKEKKQKIIIKIE